MHSACWLNTTLALIPLHDLSDVDTGDDLSTEAAYASLVPTALALISACDRAIQHALAELPGEIASEKNAQQAAQHLLASIQLKDQQAQARFPHTLSFTEGQNLLTGQRRNDRRMPILEEILRKDYESNPRYPTKPLPQKSDTNQTHSLNLFVSSELKHYRTQGFHPWNLEHLLQFAPDERRETRGLERCLKQLERLDLLILDELR
jgi:hypothetical protein